MASEQSYWDSVRACREMVAELISRTEKWIQRTPEMRRLLMLQDRAVARLSNVHPEIPGVEQRRQRANLLHGSRSARFKKIWEEKAAFTQEALTKFDDLAAVLITDEVERRKASINWGDPGSILSGLEGAAQRLEEYWESRPGQSGVVSGTDRHLNSPRATTKRPRRSDRDDPMAEVNTVVKQLHAAGCSHAEICERLANMPRPPMVKWRNLPWPTAFRNETFRASVKTKLSKMIHEEIS